MERDMYQLGNDSEEECPAPPTNSTVSCLLCWSPSVTPAYLKIESSQGVEALQRQLTHWFILRRVLELPLEWCAQYLLLFNGSGGVEEGWLQLCTNCLQTFVQKFWQIHQQIGELEDKRQRLQKKLRSKLKDGAVNCDISKESSSVAMEIRELVVPGIGEIVERRMMEMEVKIEEDEGTDALEMSDDDWQPMEEEEELATEEKQESSHLQRKVDPRKRKLPKKPLERIATGLPKRKKKKKLRAKRYIYPCELCNVRAFEFLEDFQRHQRLHAERKLVPAVDDNGQSLDCQLCSFPAVDSQELMYHNRLRHEILTKVIYECPLAPTHCKKNPSQWRLMFSHVTKMHPEEVQEQLFQRYLYCDQCPFKGEMPKHLLAHKRRKHGNDVQEPPLETVQGLKCPNCDILCATQKQLRSHVNSEHRRVNRFLCGICGKGFLYEGPLRRHEVTHTKNTKEWVCHVCGVDFTQERSLTWHLSRYHGPENETDGKDVKLFRCRYCDLTSPYGPVIRKHLQTHKEAGQWKCERCGKFYMNRQGLLRHQRINHNESGERVKCQNCKREFSSREGLDTHLRRYCKLKGSK